MIDHVTFHFDHESMDAVRISARYMRPFNKYSVICLHCIDLSAEKFTPATSFACLEMLCVLGHFSFPSDLEICPEMHANEMHELYNTHQKVSPTLNSYQNTNNSVKHEVI